MYYPNNLWRSFKYRKTLAFTDPQVPNTLFLSIKKLSPDVESIAATIIYESIHALDDAETNYTFGHGNNRAPGKENTAPYWIGNLAYKILTNNPDALAMNIDLTEDDIDLT